MPEICRFYGIIIYMFFNDHNPPHFKVKYSEFEANILINGFSYERLSKQFISRSVVTTQIYILLKNVKTYFSCSGGSEFQLVPYSTLTCDWLLTIK